MRVIAVQTCECEIEGCYHSETTILCLAAEDDADKDEIKSLAQRHEADILNLPSTLSESFWKKIDMEVDIFKAGKQLIRLTKR
jgi:hypothetical protein